MVQVVDMGIADILNALLHEIEKLYNSAALSLLHKRVIGYHGHENYSEKPHAKDIKSSLLDCIDDVVVDEKSEIVKKRAYDIGSPVLGASASSAHEVGRYSTNRFRTESRHTVFPVAPGKKQDGTNPYLLDKKRIGELSKYFKEKTNGVESDPGIKDKLKHSVWDHINASVACARRGDKRNAKMHADIANTAFKEVAHYMTEDQYSALTAKVHDRLDVLKNGHEKNDHEKTPTEV